MSLGLGRGAQISAGALQAVLGPVSIVPWITGSSYIRTPKSVNTNWSTDSTHTKLHSTSIRVAEPLSISSMFSTTNFTVEGWFYRENNGNANWAIFNMDSGDRLDLGYIADPTWGGGLDYTLGGYDDGGYRGTDNSNPESTIQNQWFHWAFSKSGSTMRLFHNGTLKVSWSNSDSFAGQPMSVFGGWPGNFNGWVDEFRVSDIARYTGNFTPHTTPHVNDANTVYLLHGSAVADDGGSTTTQYELQTPAPDTQVALYRTPITWDSQTGSITPNNNETHIPGGKSIYFNTGILNNSSNIAGKAIGTGDFTIELWFRRSGGGTQSFIYFGDSNQEVALMRSGEISWYSSDGDGPNCRGGNAPENEWHHLCYQRTGSTIRCYIDGVNRAQDTGTTTNLGDGGSFTLGGSSNFGQLINGYMQELRISKVARYGSSFTPPTTPHQNDDDTLLLLHGDTLVDDATLGNVLVPARTNYVETTAYGEVSINNTDYKTGSGSLDFGATYSHIDTGWDAATQEALFKDKYWTFECWARVDNPSTANTSLFSTADFHIGFEQNNQYGFLGYSPNWSNQVLDGRAGGLGETQTVSGRWYHIALVRANGLGIRLYIDGVLRDASTGGNFGIRGQRTLQIGKASTWSGANSNRLGMDNIRISSTARYTANFTPPTVEFDNDADTLLLINGNISWADELGKVYTGPTPPPQVNPSTSTVSVNNTEPTEGDTITYTIELIDGYGNPYNNTNIIPSATTDNGTVSTPTHQGGNTWTFTHTRSDVGTSTISISHDGNAFPDESIYYKIGIQTPTIIATASSGFYQQSSWTLAQSDIQVGDLLVMAGTAGYSSANSTFENTMQSKGWTTLASQGLTDTYSGWAWTGFKYATVAGQFPGGYTSAGQTSCTVVGFVFRNNNADPVYLNKSHNHSTPQSSTAASVPGKATPYYLIKTSHHNMSTSYYNGWTMNDTDWQTTRAYNLGYRSNVLAGYKLVNSSNTQNHSATTSFAYKHSTYGGYTDSSSMIIQVW